MSGFNETIDDNAVALALDNGLTVTYEHLPYAHSAAAGVWIKTGSANESANMTGVSHFLEHLFFKGTPARTARQILEQIESRGGHINAFTSREYTCIYVRTLYKHISSAIDILADIVRNSTFAEMEKERNVILEEIASIEDVPEDYVHELLAQRMWPGHPLGRSVSGYAETVAAIGIDDIRRYYADWYHPANMYFSIAGNFDVESVLAQVTGLFGPLETRPPLPRPEPPKFSGGIEISNRDIGQDHFCFGFPGGVVGDDRRYVYDTLWCALGGGSTSRLFQRIREDEGLAYSIYTFNSSYITAGLFGLYAAVAPERFAHTAELAFEEIRKLRDGGLSPEELEMNREQLQGGMLMSLESAFNRMQRMAKSMMYYGRIIRLDDVIAGLNAVTVEDVSGLCRDIFQPEKCCVVAVGPVEHAPIKEIAL